MRYHRRPGAARVLILTIALGAAAACDVRPVSGISTPAGDWTAQPNLTRSGERLYLSWISQEEDRPAEFRFAVGRLVDSRPVWSDPATIAASESMFVNWADFPSVLPLAEDTLAAHWLRRSADGPYAYDTLLTVSRDGGLSWSDGLAPHRDGVAAEHGFVSLVGLEKTALGAIWLDGRRMTADVEDPATQLMYSRWDGVRFGPEVVLDERVCDCCQTSAVRTSYGLVVAYRDREAEERRDISVVRMDQDGWSDPERVHDDDWRIAGCPVNGPAMARAGPTLGLSWFTASPYPAVMLARSENEGRTFEQPVRVDDAVPLGRVSVAAMSDGAIVVVWMEQATSSQAAIRARRYPRRSPPDPAVTIARTSLARASGFPRAVAADGSVWVGWTDPGPPARVRLTRLDYNGRG